jgi:hypothetical protein
MGVEYSRARGSKGFGNTSLNSQLVSQDYGAPPIGAKRLPYIPLSYIFAARLADGPFGADFRVKRNKVPPSETDSFGMGSRAAPVYSQILPLNQRLTTAEAEFNLGGWRE